MVISPRVCPSNPFKLFWRAPQWVTESQIHCFSMVRQQARKCCAGFLCPGLSPLTKTNYLKESAQNYQGSLSVKNCFVKSNPAYFLQQKHSTWICDTLKIQAQEGARAGLCYADSSSVLLHNPLLLRFSQVHSSNFTRFMHEVVTNSNL